MLPVRLQRVWHSPVTVSCLVSVVVVLSLWLLRSYHALETLELAAYDWLLRQRPANTTVPPRVVLITVTEEDLRAQGHWPLTDAVVAQALEALLQHQPRGIGLDIYRDIAVPPGRAALDALFTTHPHIVVIQKFSDTAAASVPAPAVLRDSAQVGFNDIVVDPGGTVRRGLLFLDDGHTVSVSFALRLALLYLRHEGITLQPDPTYPQHVRLGQTTIRPFEAYDGGYVNADARGYQFLLDFRTMAFPMYSLAQLLAGSVPPSAIQDKIVLIGVLATSVQDVFYTPYSRSAEPDQKVSGVLVHAQSTSQLLRHALDHQPPLGILLDWQEALWLLVWSVMAAAVGSFVRSPGRFTLMGLGGLGSLGLAGYSAMRYDVWLPVVPPALAWGCAMTLATAFVSYREKQQRALLMRLFAQHVSPEVAATIWQHREAFLDGGRPRSQRLVATVFFSDLMGFTSVAEQLSPTELLDWLNVLMESMAQQVMAHGGVIDKYIGDAIMAVFGVPVARTTATDIAQDAVHAVDCALAMEQQLIHLNQRWSAAGLPSIGMRIGIFTGPLVAGSLGSTHRLEYTVLGDTVNVAARLESFDKEMFPPLLPQRPCRILIGETTLAYLGKRFGTEKVGTVQLKGKEQPITAYRVLGYTGQCSPHKVEKEA